MELYKELLASEVATIKLLGEENNKSSKLKLTSLF
jgi:hypothetical protein